jgi:hypothetical protein
MHLITCLFTEVAFTFIDLLKHSVANEVNELVGVKFVFSNILYYLGYRYAL